MKNTFKKLLSLVLALVMVAGFIPPVQQVAAAGITEQTEQASDLLADATFSSSAWNWSGSGQFSYDSNSTVTNGENSLRSWRFSSTAQSVNSYSRLQLNLNKSYDMTNKDLVFDIKTDPAADLTSYYVGIVPMNSNGEYLHDYTNYKEYQINFTGDGWQTVTVDNSILKAYLLDGKGLNDVKYLYLSFYFPKGQAHNIYIDNMHMVEHKVGTAATEAASDLLTNATVVENTADGKTYAYEHNNTKVIYGEQSTGSHKFYAASGATDTFRVKYDLGKSYDLTNKNLVFDMLAYRGSSSFIVTLYNSKNQQISYNVSLTTPDQWAQIRPAILQGMTSGMNLSDVRYIAITARFLDETSRADRAFYIDNVRIENIDVHYTALQNKNIVFIGDSITNSYGYKGWSGELEEHYLINRYNIGVGGTSYANITGRDRIYQQVSKIPNVDVDFFVLNGGVNDIWSNANLGSVSNISVSNATVNSFDTNTTAGSMEQMFCYLRTNYPNAQILFVINYICYNSDWDGVRFRDEFAPLAKALCEKWDVPYVDLVNNDGFNAKFSALDGVHTYDGVHGNDLGYELVMRELAPALLSLCGGTEQTEQNSDRLAYAQAATNWSGTGNLSFDNNSSETNGNDSIRSWKFTASSAQTENASMLLNLSQMERFDLTDKGIAFDVKFEGGAQRIGVQLYDNSWQSLTGDSVIWTECDAGDGWYTVTIGADAVSQLLAYGKTLQDVSLVGFTFDFAKNKGKTQTVYVDNFRVVDVKNNATEETEAASDLLYGASFVEGTFGNEGFGYNLKNPSFLKGKDSKYALRLYAADDKTAWATATFKLPKAIDLTDSTLQFDILQKNQKAANVDLYDSNMKLISSDSYILKDTGWQTFEVNSLFGLASGKTAADLADVCYIKFSFSFDTAEVGRCIVIDNLSMYENVQYDSMVSGLNGLYLGDSISEAIGFKGWAGEMAEHYGVNGCNVSVSGATLAKNDIFSQLSRVPTGTEVDFVMLNGGVNDVWRNIALGSVSAEGTTQFNIETAIGALEHLFATIQTTYPDAEVFYILNYVCVQPGYPSNAFSNDFAPLARQACAKWNVHCLDLVDNAAFNAEFDATAGIHTYDGVHPNKSGYDVLTSHIVSFMEDALFTNDQDPYWVLEQDETVNLSLTEDLYVDLNGHDLSGTIETNGYAVYAIDATTDKYTCDKMGYFTAVDGNGDAVVPVAHFRSYKNGSVKRYISIPTQKGYTFHRFYVGITKQSLAPSVTGVGYKAVFCGDEMVRSMLDENNAYGYKLWLDGYAPITRSRTADQFVSGDEITLRIKNFDVENFGQTPVHASVWIKLSDGTVIESSQYSVTLREMVESVNGTYKSYTKNQLQAVRDMVKANETMLGWQVENILKEEVIRGEAFMAGANALFSLNTQEALETVSFEYRITDGQKIALAMLCDWNNFYGYFYFNRDGVQGSYAGVTTEKLTDGYIRVTLDIPKLTQLTGNPINVIDSLFIRGAWSDAEGYVDNIQYTVSQGGGEDGGDDQSGVIVNPGASFTAGTTMSIPLVEGTYDTVTFDYKFTGGTKLWFCIGDSTVSKFYGLFKLDGNGVAETYKGISSEVLDNGYIRVTMDLALINRTNHVWNTDNAPATVSTFFLRGDWSDANGVIDNIRCMTADAGGDEEEGGDSGYTEIVTPGGSFEANKGITVNFEAGAYDVVTFDYKITNGGEMQACLLSADWAKFYGYFKFNANGLVQDYDGVSAEKLSNGYIRVTLKLADLGITNWQNNRDNAPETVGILYVRGDISSAAGSVDNIRCLMVDESQEDGDSGYTEIVTPGTNVTAGVNQSIYLTEGAYDIVTFDYKFTSGTKMYVALLQADWAKYYGYIKVDANGVVGSYDGVTFEKLSNGYIRVTMELAKITVTNSANNADNAPETIAQLFVRGDWSDANATIDNIRCLTGNGGDDSVQDVIRGEELQAGLDKQFNFEAKDYEAVIFDYKIGSGEYFWMNLVSPDWSKYYGNFKFDANGEAYDYAGITTEKLSDGYIRVTLLTVEVTRTNSKDNLSNIPATFDKMYIRGDMNTSHGYIDNLQVIAKGDMAYDFTAGKETVIHCREGAYGEVAFTYSIDSGSSFDVALKNPAGDKYYGSFSFNAKGETQDYTGVTATVLSDGKVHVVIDLDKVDRTGDQGNLSAEPVTVNGLYILGSSAASGTVHSAVFTPVEDDTVYRGIPMFAGGDVTLDIGTGVYSQVSFEYCVTNDSDFQVCFIGEDWSHFYGYYNFDAVGACLTYPGVSTQKLDDGYVKVTLDIDALTKTNNKENLDGKPSLLKKLYIRGDWSAASGYIDRIRTVAGEREIVRGKEIPASSAIDFSAHAASYASVTLDYKITSGQMKIQLLDNSGKTSDTYIFGVNGESKDYAGITTSVRGDGYRKITFNLADMTNAPAKVAKVRVLADSTADGYVDNAQFLETETATSAKIAVISDVHLGYDNQGYVDVNRQAQRLERILNNYKLMGVDAVVVTGDLVDHGTLEEKKALMDTFAEIWLRVFPNFTNDLTGEFVQPIIIYGNHDLDLIEASYWPEAFGEFTPGFMTNVNGYYFVGAHYLEEYSATDYIGAAREDSNGNPFFYLQHCDLEGLLYNHTNVDHGSGLTALDDLWNDSNAVTLSGHTHFTSVDERSIWQPSNDDEPRFTSISVPSINYGRVEDTYSLNGNREQVVQGLILELEGSQVSITRLSFLDETDTDGEQIGAVWTWDAADPADKPYGYETRAEATAKPVFASGAKISVTKQTSTSATISFNAATVNTPAGFSDMVQGYRIAVVDKATGEVVSEQILTTPYHIATDAGSLPTTYQATISDLTAGISYEIRVYAIEFYQVESDPLTLAIKLS